MSASREGVERVCRRTVWLWPNRWKPSTRSICWNGVVPQSDIIEKEQSL